MTKRLISTIITLVMILSLIPAFPVQAATTINIGDYVQIGKYYDEPILWRCVDIDENGPLMLSDKIITTKAFDSYHINELNYQRNSAGSNLWVTSNIRSWLNSTASAGNVNWNCGNPPFRDNYNNGYAAEKGLLADGNFTSSERNSIKAVNQKSLLNLEDKSMATCGSTTHLYNNSIASVVQNYDEAYAHNVTDKMFLLDVRQVNKVYQNLGNYFICQPTKKAVENSDYKGIYLSINQNWFYSLRSPCADIDSSSSVRIATNFGISNSYAMDYLCGIRPAFYINLSSAIYISGNGSVGSPYVLTGHSVSKNYSIKVKDSETGIAVSGARLLIGTDVYTTNTNGIISFSNTGEEISDLYVHKEGYNLYSNALYTLADGLVNEIFISKITKNLTINPSSFNFAPSGNDTLIGPSLNFGGKQFNLFEMPIGSKFELTDKIKVEYDAENKKYSVLFTPFSDEIEVKLKPDPKDTYWRSQYRQIKEIVKAHGGKVNTPKLWNAFSSVRGSLKKMKMDLGFNCEAYTLGYMEFSNVNGLPAFTEGGIVIFASADLGFSYPLPPAPVVCLNFGIGIDATGKLTLTMKDVATFNPSIDITGSLEMNVKPRLGISAGVKNIANAEAEIEGDIDSTFDLSPSSKKLEERLIVDMVSTIYLRYQVLMFFNGNYTYEIAKTRIYPRTSQTQSLSLMTIDPNDFMLEPRDYAKNKSSFVANNIKLMDIATNTSTIKKNVYPYGEPKLVSLGNGKQLMVWVDDDLSRTSANRTALMYSVYNGSSWSIPMQVSDDGTADFAPRLTTVNGNAYLVWQNANKVFSDSVTMDEMAQGVDISYARFDGNSFVDLSKIKSQANTVYEMSPVIAANGQEVSVVWTENSLNNQFGLEGTNSIYRATLSNGSWSTPQLIDGNLSLVTDLDTGYNNGTNVIAYSVDTDGNFATTTDNEIFMVKGSQKQRLTNDTTADNSVQFVKQGAGADLYWNANGAVKYIGGCDGANIQTLNISGNLSGFNVLANQNNGKALVYEQPNGFKNELYGIFYNKATSSWGQPIKLTSLNNKIRLANGYMDEDDSIKMAFDLATVTPLSDTNSEPYGNVDLIVANIANQCDVSLVGGIAYDDNLVAPNANIALYVNVKNNGIDTINQVAVVVKDGNDDVVSSQNINAIITSGATQEITIPYTVPSSISKNAIKVEVSPVGMTDVNLTDNYLTTTIGYTDIEVSTPTIVNGTSSRQVQATIKNIGYDTASDISISFVKDSSAGDVIETKTIQSLSAGATQTVTFDIPSLMLDFQSEADKKLFYISSSTSSQESLYANNNMSVAVDAIKVTSVALDKSTLEMQKGGSATLTATVSPVDAVNKAVVWLSDDESVASVDANGVVNAIGEGMVNITAVTVDGNKTAVCNVTVLPNDIVLFVQSSQKSNGVYKLNTLVKNTKSEVKNFKVIFALYNSDKLVSINIQDVSLIENASTTIEGSINSSVAGNKIKFFAIDSLNNLMPYSDVMEIDSRTIQ